MIKESVNDGATDSMVSVRPLRFVHATANQTLTLEQKIGILAADSVLIPIMIGNDYGVVVSPEASDERSSVAPAHCQNQEVKQVFLVHLQIRKMAVTVYTSEEAANEDSKPAVNDEKVASDQ